MSVLAETQAAAAAATSAGEAFSGGGGGGAGCGASGRNRIRTNRKKGLSIADDLEAACGRDGWGSSGIGVRWL